MEVKNEFKSIKGDRKDLLNYRDKFAKIQPDIVIDLISYFAQDAKDLIKTFKQITNRIILISSGDVYRSYEIFKDDHKELIKESSKEGDELRTKLYPYRGIDSSNYMLENYEKIVVENIIRGQSEIDWTILRLGALFGECDNQRKLKEYTEPMLKNERVIGIDGKKKEWKWTRGYIKNVAHAVRLIIEKELESRNEIFNVGNEKAYKEIEIINQLREITNWKGKVELVDDLEKESYNYNQDLILNTDKIRRKLGYREIIEFKEGLKRTVEYEEKITW